MNPSRPPSIQARVSPPPSAPYLGAMTRRWCSIALAPLLWGCSQDPTIPKIEEEPVTLSLALSTTTFRQGKPDTISVTATSKLTYTATIQFATDCQLLVTIRNQAGAAVVPPNGKHTCVPLATNLVIPAEGSVTRRFVWTGSDTFVPPGSATMLPPGTYFVSAYISALNYSTVAAAVKVELVAP